MSREESSTIAAISTPIGTGGIGVVRLSGDSAKSIVSKFFRPVGKRRLEDLTGYQGILGRVYDTEGDIDDAILYFYKGPKSYTGEDVVEISCHGGMWILQRVLRLCLDNGAVLAEAGEFTKRAFLHGKLSLTEAEAVIDLIQAQGNSAMRVALAAKDGVLTARIQEISGILVGLSGHLAAWIDYPEEEISEISQEELLDSLQKVVGEMKELLLTWDQGRIIKEGIRTVIVGKPNVGKSTFMNMLAGEERSIVTDIPGTTRDIVEDSVKLGEYTLYVADTAGMRVTDDPVESIGVAKAKDRMKSADLILALFDSSDELEENDRELLFYLKDKPCIAIINKMDLPTQLPVEEIKNIVPRVVFFSAINRSGLPELEREIAAVLEMDKIDISAPMLYNERQRQSVMNGMLSLQEATEMLGMGLTFDAVNVSIDYALDELLSITGEKVSDRVLQEVFSRFCVGK